MSGKVILPACIAGTFVSMKILEDNLKSALQYGFRLLGYRDRSRKEMLDKLAKKGFSGGVAEGAVAYLEEKGFIDDRKLAENLKRVAVERRHFGKRGIRSYLIRRGVPEDIAAFFSGQDEDEADTAKRLVEKKLRHMQDCDATVIKRRVWGLLERRGFSPETVRTVIKSLNFKEEIE